MAISLPHVWFEHHRLALGIGESDPRISWRFDGNVTDWEQSSYDIEIARPGRPEPQVFSVESADSVLVPWPDSSLQSSEEATVRVRASDGGDRETPWSDAVTVEPGLLAPEDWQGAVTIAADKEPPEDEPHQPVLFRRDFAVNGSFSSARLYITALGVYKAVINGERVGDHEMAPGWQSYHNRLEYNTYDVTHLLTDGQNAIGVTVGEGWYAGRLGFDGGQRNIYGDTLGLLCLLAVTHEDGSKTYLSSDTSWQSGTGPIITSEIYDGEVYDSRLEQDGWSSPGYENPDWLGVKEITGPEGTLVSPDAPPVRKVETVELVDILTSDSGKTILDFGQNLVGWLRLRVEGPSGQTINLVHTEVLEDGEVGTRPLRFAKQRDNITLSGDGVQEWEPSFTFHGFRYVQVVGWPTDTTPLDKNSVTAVVVHSDMERTGSFQCSNPLLNKLHENIGWSMKGNFLSIPTDCPQRDERMGWTGDIHAFSRTANFLYDPAGFLRAWLKDARSEQLENKYAAPHVVPNILGPASATSIWGDAIVTVPWEIYQTTGDKVLLEEQYPGAKDWLDKGILRNDIGLWNRSTFQYADWLDPEAPPDAPGNATTNKYLVSDAYLLDSTEKVANISSILSLDDDSSYYSDWHADLLEKFQNAWISSDGMVANETQTGLALPLYFDLFKTPEHYSSAADRLVDIVAENEFKIGTGFAGTHLFGHTLTKYGKSDTFYSMLLQTETPSWLYQVVMNGTTTWERWDSMLPDGSINPGEMTSFNHYAVGSVGSWMYATIGGLSPAKPGWKEINVEPIPGGDLTHAHTEFTSPYGLVSTEWWVEGESFRLIVIVPPNTKANVRLPGAEEVETVGSGTHEFTT